MKALVLTLCLGLLLVGTARGDSFNCRRVGHCLTAGQAWGVAVSGSYTYLEHDAFGLRTVEVRGLQSLAEGAYSGARDSASRAAVPRGRVYVAEAGGALVGGVLVGGGSAAALGYALGEYALSSGGSDAFLGGVIFGAAIGMLGYPAGCAMGTATVGRWMKCEGNTGRAYAGAYIGLLAAIPVAVVAGTVEAGAGGSGGVTTCIAALCPAVGAVISYNTGVSSSYGARFAPPTLAYRSRLGPDRQRHSTFDCRLMTVRF